MNQPQAIDLANTEPSLLSSASVSVSVNGSCSITPIDTTEPHARTRGPPCDDVRALDVLPGRGKVDHQGNVMFRKLVAERVNEYKDLQSKGDRPGTLQLVRMVIEQVTMKGGRFLDKNWKNEWVEMTDKERLDKADRALRDASRNVTKRTRSEGQKYDTNKINNSSNPQPSHGYQYHAEQVMFTEIAPTTTTIADPNPVAQPTALTCPDLGVTASPTGTRPVATSNDDESSTHPQPELLDETIFDTSEALHAALLPRSKATTSPELEFSCGSLFESQVAMDIWGQHNNNSSSSSLSVADLIAQRIMDGDGETKTSDATNHNRHDDDLSNDMQDPNHTNTSRGPSIRNEEPIKSTTDNSSAMSLDLFSVVGEQSTGGEIHHPQQPHWLNPKPAPQQQHHHQKQTSSSSSSFLPNNKGSLIEVFDEDMLVDSFNHSLDFFHSY